MNETTSPEIEWMLEEVPVLCQARGCERVPETWCPLCTQFLCAEHDELTRAADTIVWASLLTMSDDQMHVYVPFGFLVLLIVIIALRSVG